MILLEDSDEASPSIVFKNKRKRSKSRERKIQMRPREEAKKRRTHSRERVVKDFKDRDRHIRDLDKIRSRR